MREKLDAILGEKVSPMIVMGKRLLPVHNTDKLLYSDDGYFLANTHLEIPLDLVMNVDSSKYSNILYLNGKLMKKRKLVRFRFDLSKGWVL